MEKALKSKKKCYFCTRIQMQVHRQTDNKQPGDNIKGKPSNSKACAQKAISTAVKKKLQKKFKKICKEEDKGVTFATPTEREGSSL
jgi:hypothetical protein